MCCVIYLALYADSSSNSFSAAAEETEISLNDEIRFLKFVVIPSFDEAAKKKQTREMYIQDRVKEVFTDKNKIKMLLPLYSSIPKTEAKEELALLERAKERAEERHHQLELARG